MNDASKTAPLSIGEVRHRINQLLEEQFSTRQQQADKIAPSYFRLWQAIGQVSSKGKRLRPYLAYLAYMASNGTDSELALRVGTSLELLHICLLTLDDFIDRDYVRHDEPTIAGTYQQYYKPYVPDEEERDHFAQSSALLSTPLLLSESYQYIWHTPLPEDVRGRIMDLLQTVIFTVAGGELLDTEAPMLPVHDSDSLVIAEYKTAYYSCSVPLAIGSVLAGANPAIEQQYIQIGRDLGIAYQLYDDLLGVFGDEITTGKSSFSDLREGKRTYLLQKTYELTSDRNRAIIDDTLIHHRDDNVKLQQIKDIMVECGARQATEELAVKYTIKAKAITAQIAHSYPLVHHLDAFMDSLVGRHA